MRKLFALLFAVGCSSTPAETHGPLDVTTDKGVVHGYSDGTVRSFLGVPFAAPPTGALRFMPPTPAAAWTTPLDAATYKPACAQLDTNGALSQSSSEDCLYVNIWAPDADVKNAPVFVWIYGGGFVVGSASDPLYNGVNAAVHSNAIVVTLGYRLGSLGFTSHPALAAAEGVTTSPSQGLLDQQAALRWVQKNIAGFGGDPTNVTVAGESAGAVSVCSQLVMPGSNGLFARAIIESGLCVSMPAVFQPPSVADDQGTRLATALGCTDAAALTCMQSKDTASVLTALPGRHALFGPTGDSWAPVVDGASLPKAPADAIAAGAFAKVPTIIGTNLNEGQLFGYLWGTPAPTPADVRGSLSVLFGASGVDAIATKYNVDTDAPTAYVDMLTDAITCMGRATARTLSSAGAPTYLYQFTYPYQVYIFPGLTTTHGFELPFVFRNGYGGSQLSDADLLVADTVDSYWFSFASTGVPAGPATWTAFTKDGDTHLDINAAASTSTGLDAATCDFWDTLGI